MESNIFRNLVMCMREGYINEGKEVLYSKRGQR